MRSKRVDLISLKVCREKSIKYGDRQINSPMQALQIVKEFIGETDREYFVVMNLNVKNEPCSIEICSMGLVDQTLVHPREVFKSAITTNSVKIIIFHTHPSGSVSPSKDDIDITKNLMRASAIMQIPILDHIIIGDNHYFSFKEEGLMSV